MWVEAPCYTCPVIQTGFWGPYLAANWHVYIMSDLTSYWHIYIISHFLVIWSIWPNCLWWCQYWVFSIDLNINPQPCWYSDDRWLGFQRFFLGFSVMSLWTLDHRLVIFISFWGALDLTNVIVRTSSVVEYFEDLYVTRSTAGFFFVTLH